MRRSLAWFFLALVAPRRVLITDGEEDSHADPESALRAVNAAGRSSNDGVPAVIRSISKIGRCSSILRRKTEVRVPLLLLRLSAIYSRARLRSRR